MQLENLEMCMELENTWITPFQVQRFYSIHYNQPELSVQFYNFKSPTSKKKQTWRPTGISKKMEQQFLHSSSMALPSFIVLLA